MNIVLIKGLSILFPPNMPAQADMMLSLLHETFPKVIPERSHLIDSNFAPWAWSCNDTALAEAVEERLKALGVGEDFSTVQTGSEEDDKEADDCWSMVKTRFG
jgi:hypothetical protein